MIPDKFSSAVDAIVERDARFDRDAYFFVRDALEYTAKAGRRGTSRAGRSNAPPTPHHVTGQELLEGIRQYALKEYGSMATTVFEHWRVSRCEHFGAIVFNLIEAGIFGKNATDTLDDFRGGYEFRTAFIEPFLPPSQSSRAARRAG